MMDNFYQRLKCLDRILSINFDGIEISLSGDDLSYFHKTIFEFRNNITGNTHTNGGFNFAVATRFLLKSTSTKEELMREYSRDNNSFDSVKEEEEKYIREFKQGLTDRLAIILAGKSGSEYEKCIADAKKVVRNKLSQCSFFRTEEDINAFWAELIPSQFVF